MPEAIQLHDGQASVLSPGAAVQLTDPAIDLPMSVHPLDGPGTLTLITTYTCTAACRECCFECTPKVEGKLSLDDLLTAIDQGVEQFPSLKMAVFTGGECFLLGRNLDSAIAHASSLGLRTRCVSNGYWARTPDVAAARVKRLGDAGLTELNISTGDEHQEWVPFESVVNGALASAAAGIRTVVVIEGKENAAFTPQEVAANRRIVEFLKSHPNRHLLNFIRNVWIPFHEDTGITQPGDVYRRADNPEKLHGCDNILDNLVITPHRKVASCCGLTFEHIPEMKLGTLGQESLRTYYDNQLQDFLKIWLWVEGPENILLFAASKDPQIEYDNMYTHTCQACAVLHLDPRIRNVLRQHYHEKVSEVMFRYFMKRELKRRTEPGYSVTNGETYMLSGAEVCVPVILFGTK
jgi:pyruvate-formate lyase-activating enzyme